MRGRSLVSLAMTTFAVLAIATECRAQQADLDHAIWHIKTTL